jgi:mannose/fructose/N-acetylgalactosamine-specific phosphotransferase system component IID
MAITLLGFRMVKKKMSGISKMVKIMVIGLVGMRMVRKRRKGDL